MAALEGGAAGLGIASGTSAVFYSIINVAEAGDEIVSANNLYGGTYTQFNDILPKLGIKVNFVDPNDPQNFAAAITPKTKALFCESVSNPGLDVADLEAISKIANDHGIPLIVDSTFSTPYLTRPIEHGASIVVHSLTKWLGGQGNGIGGIVIDSGTFDWKNGNFPSTTSRTAATTASAGARSARAPAPRFYFTDAYRSCATSVPVSLLIIPGNSFRASRPCPCVWKDIAKMPSPWPSI